MIGSGGGRGEVGAGLGGGEGWETSDTWSEPDTTISLQRLGLPRYLLVNTAHSTIFLLDLLG